MSYSCKILLDSVSETGKRITTMEITFPRCVLAEAETHRVLRGWDGNVEELVLHNVGINVDENLSRNSASSRAIPISKMVQRVRENPFIPEKWGKPVKGMGAKEYYEAGSPEGMKLTRMWNAARGAAIIFVEDHMNIGNKEDLNRLLEPFMWHTAIITATEWDNFFKLRTNSAADWKIRKIADLMYDAYHAFDHLNANWKDDREVIEPITSSEWTATRPQKLEVGEWHCPLVYVEDDELIDKYWFEKTNLEKGNMHEFRLKAKKKISVARCARVSYLTHDGKRDIEKDLELFERLRTSRHWSPFEHVATPYYKDYGQQSMTARTGIVKDEDESAGVSKWSDAQYINYRSGNFIGWKQFRKEFADENCTNFRKE